MRWVSIVTLLVLLFPFQPVLAATRPLSPSVKVTPLSATAPINSTVLYQVSVNNIPRGGMHCVKVDLLKPTEFKIYPATGYSYYHFYSPNTLDFKLKLPNQPQRKFFFARVSWSKDYYCKSIRITNYSSRVEIIVTK